MATWRPPKTSYWVTPPVKAAGGSDFQRIEENIELLKNWIDERSRRFQISGNAGRDFNLGDYGSGNMERVGAHGIYISAGQSLYLRHVRVCAGSPYVRWRVVVSNPQLAVVWDGSSPKEDTGPIHLFATNGLGSIATIGTVIAATDRRAVIEPEDGFWLEFSVE